MIHVGKKRIRAKFKGEEDEKLRSLVEKYGENQWDQIASEMPGRNVRQCRERWKHYLSCQKSDDTWTQEEDDLIGEQVQLLGGKWTRIAAMLPGRTDLQVKNRWGQIFNKKRRRCPRSVREKPPAPPEPVAEPSELWPNNSEELVDMFASNQGMDVQSWDFLETFW